MPTFNEFLERNPEIKMFSHQEQWLAYDQYCETILASLD